MISMLTIGCLTAGLFCGCGSSAAPAASTAAAAPASAAASSTAAAASSEAAAATQAAAAALDFPKYAITMNTSKSGSNVDYLARAFAKTANNYLPESMVVNSCAGQVEAVSETMNSDPDGYTLAFVNNTVIINDVMEQTDFNSLDDVEIVATVATNVSNWVSIKADFAKANNINTFNDLLEYTKAHPGELIISDRTASNTNTAVNQLLGIGMEVTPADVGTSTDRLTNFLGGSCDIIICSYGLVEQYIQTGEVVCLAVMSGERSGFSPDVPCTAELGYPELGCPSTYYICAPKGTPAEIIAYLDEIAEKVTADEGYISDINANSVETQFEDSAAAYQNLSGQKQNMIDLGMGKGFQG